MTSSIMSSSLVFAASSDVTVDANLLRNGIRLVHCLQKERGSSCAYYADNIMFENAMLEARSSSDIAAALIFKELAVISSLFKIRNLIDSHKNPRDSDDTLALHRIFVCFNTLISHVVHDCILKQISAGTDQKPRNSTIKNRHRRGLSSDINDKLSSDLLITPETADHKIFPSPVGARPSDRARNRRLETVHSMDDDNRSRELSPPPPPPPPASSSSVTKPPGTREKRPPVKTSPSRRKVIFRPTVPRVRQLLGLLHLFVQLKESAGIERAILSSLLAFRGTDDPSMGFLVNDLILEVENQRSLVKMLERLPEDQHRNLVLELATLSPRLEELQSIILSDFESLRNAEYDSETIWHLITLYVDKLHSVELLLVEELECCLPVTMKKVISSGALSAMVAPPIQPKALVNSLSTSVEQMSLSRTPEENQFLNKALQKLFPAANGHCLASEIESLSAEEVKRRLLGVLQSEDEDSGPTSEAEDSSSSDDGVGHQYSAATSLKEELNRALTSPPDRTPSKEWGISIYELKFSKRIGVGAAATTYLADWTGQKVAVKVASTSEFGLEGWRTEVDALQRLHHPNIIRLLGSVYHESPLTYCLVLEYCNAGDLSTVLKYPTPRNFFFTVAIGIATAMTYLHSRHVIHRDLKPANVLCDGNVASGKFTVKVTDFGVATEARDSQIQDSDKTLHEINEKNLTGETGTYRWMAPEVIRHESYSTMADVYSFAVMLWQFVTHEEPFLDVSALDAARLGALEKQRPQIPGKTPKEIIELIETNWSDRPADRCPMEKVAESLRRLQNTLSSEEMTFLESPNGHPVYVYEELDLEEELEVKKRPKVSGKRGPAKNSKQAEDGNKRSSLLSSFFGQKRADKKKKGTNERM